MTTSIFFGGSVLAAVIAGMIALFAPCCISVMLPAYFASSFQNRRLLVAMTFLFAGGIATIILPLALGASFLRQLMVAQHTPIYVINGVLMLALAVYMLLGGQIHLPMPGRRMGGNVSVFSVYSLGIFSGIASSCCAPVLAGVIALASVASSFWLVLGLGTAYVFGMVAPLFGIALLWERYDWRASRLFRPHAWTWRFGSVERTLTFTNLATGGLLALIGVGMIWVGFTEGAMPSLAPWQVQLTVMLQHYGQVVTRWLAFLPNWAGWLIVFALLGGLAYYAFRQIEGHAVQDEDEQQEERQTEAGAGCVGCAETQAQAEGVVSERREENAVER